MTYYDEKLEIRNFMETIGLMETENVALMEGWNILIRLIGEVLLKKVLSSDTVRNKLKDHFVNTPNGLDILATALEKIGVDMTTVTDINQIGKEKFADILDEMIKIYVEDTGDHSIKDVIQTAQVNEMKMRQIKGGIVVSVSNEEEDLIERICEEGSLSNVDLSEREDELARKLTSRGLLTRSIKEEDITYRYNELEDVWRD